MKIFFKLLGVKRRRRRGMTLRGILQQSKRSNKVFGQKAF